MVMAEAEGKDSLTFAYRFTFLKSSPPVLKLSVNKNYSAGLNTKN